jgi:DNA processing protein
MTLTAEQQALLGLHLVPGLGPRLTAALLERFGSAEEVLQASVADLSEIPHISIRLAEELCGAMARLDVVKELELIARHEVHLLTRGTPEFPAPLAELPDPPPLLYARGNWSPGDANAVALVGSRRCTSYGLRITERLASGLVRAGYTVVSGLARGIDGAAHRAALKAGGRTLAVLAGGLSRIYPPEHVDLAAEVQSAGALLSEATMGMEPMAGMFPARNRLISGLSRATVVIEAAERSGALITARHAAEQGRTVCAVPGPADSAASSGTNQLIRQGAILVRHVDDIIEELEGITAKSEPTPTEKPAGLDDTQQRVWNFLKEQPRHVDEVTRHLGIGVGPVTQILIVLEMKKVVRRLPGNLYELR